MGQLSRRYVYEIGLIAIRESLYMDSEGRIIEVVLILSFLTMTDEREIIKLGLKLVQSMTRERE